MSGLVGEDGVDYLFGYTFQEDIAEVNLQSGRTDSDDIGFVKENLPVHIKVDTFDFQKYGMMEGRVRLVSKDSNEDDRTQSKQYRVLVQPTKTELIVDGRAESLQSGMTSICDVRVGKRKVIEFFLYPLLRGVQNGMGVR